MGRIMLARAGLLAYISAATPNMKRLLTWAVLFCACAFASVRTAELPNAPALELKPGDHVAVIGNALADRFQHSGWLETFIHAQYPNHDLVIRNLAVAGDEVAVRHRPENFGSAHDWLKKTQADVIFAFFGFNESFQGPTGLPKFRSDLDKFVKETQANNYSGKAPPRLVLFSPIANEKLDDPNLPDAKANNENL